VSLGIPAAVAFAGINQILARNIATLGLVAGLALAAAWLGGNLFLVRQIQALVRATKRVAAGELGVRSGLPQGQGELNQLAGAFDQMAESLERAHERRLLEEELRRKNYLSIFKFFVLDVPLRRMVAVSMDPAPDSALAPSFRGRPIGQLPASHYTPSASCLSAQPHR
jgi:HAMP domain-containing protein